jgi:cob(I)alamin adenosyltransferase
MPQPIEKQKGLIQLYCGDGKGKTTAAMGLCIRAAGNGRKVLLFQFLKANTSGEIKVLSSIPYITILKSPDKMKFTIDMTPQEKAELTAHSIEIFETIKKMATEYDLLILDEIVYAISGGFFPEDLLIDFLQNKPFSLEVAMTGQNPGQRLIQIADYVSEIKKIKHPYDSGVKGRKGIES